MHEPDRPRVQLFRSDRPDDRFLGDGVWPVRRGELREHDSHAACGNNGTVVSVFYRTVDSSATRAARDNNMYAPGAAGGGDGHAAWGDYRTTNGTLTFAAGEIRKSIDIQLLADAAYDGAADEQFAVVLSGAVGA